MALFKIAKGPLEGLANKECKEGYCYVAQDTDDHVYFLVDLNSSKRATLSAEYAQTYPVTIVEWGASS